MKLDRKVPLCALLLATLAGCASLDTPYEAYEQRLPADRTAVLIAQERQPAKPNDSRVWAVDGKSTKCTEAGCPYWVRVLPGGHSFTVVYTAMSQSAAGVATRKELNLRVPVSGMQARHVYGIRYLETQGVIQPVVDDLGENPNAGIFLGEGPERKYHKAEF